MDYLELTYDKLSVEKISDLVASPQCGAISIFCGTTRDNCDGKQVVELEYESYEKMALKVMKEICNEMRSNWTSIENIAIYHRLGVVPVKQSSVIIAVSSPHRADSILGSQYCIDNLKSRIPIWKKEKYQTSGEPGQSEWKENKECPWSNAVNESQSQPTSNAEYDDDLVQIKASQSEIMKRIERFMEKKRELLNMTNVLDFCVSNSDTMLENNEPLSSSCARVDAVLIPRKGTKSHLKVRRVFNQGPNFDNNQINLTPYAAHNVGNHYNANINLAVEERLINAEQHLLMNRPVPSDIYERIKSIEERILELESISPEYCQFWKHLPSSNTLLPPVQKILSMDIANQLKRKRQYSVSDIDKRIQNLQEQEDN